MDAPRPKTNVSPLKPAGSMPLSAGERRAKKRFVSGQIKLVFLGAEHAALNWSVDGVLIDDKHPNLAIGTTVSGILSVRGSEGRFRFSAELVRRDARTKEVALRFLNASQALQDVLTRITE
ncbi:MAG TPA: hypothetical protein VLV50_19230 [Stellaceae bacterium]|nr:hypothetical protein [Stellaceae bacterium]